MHGKKCNVWPFLVFAFVCIWPRQANAIVADSFEPNSNIFFELLFDLERSTYSLGGGPYSPESTPPDWWGVSAGGSDTLSLISQVDDQGISAPITAFGEFGDNLNPNNQLTLNLPSFDYRFEQSPTALLTPADNSLRVDLGAPSPLTGFYFAGVTALFGSGVIITPEGEVDPVPAGDFIFEVQHGPSEWSVLRGQYAFRGVTPYAEEVIGVPLDEGSVSGQDSTPVRVSESPIWWWVWLPLLLCFSRLRRKVVF